ncbi:hypothetical protein FHR70_002661 [Microvirga lupini]|uniref:Uncharacterized protein n=1 Tax=Microvirga lupini TaxID=420324 RepID=A0A7W4YX22_9HYPH|nr:hypothetical protein [Microvirga lupini]
MARLNRMARGADLVGQSATSLHIPSFLSVQVRG